MKTVKLFVSAKIETLTYICPHCEQFVSYETDGLPPKGQCHKCLQPLKFKPVYAKL